MATGSGKTFTAITFIYRLLKYTNAKRILFVVDTKNLGEQAEQEFMAYLPNDDNRKFTELYGVHRLKSSFIPTDNQVYISTIQRLDCQINDKQREQFKAKSNGKTASEIASELLAVYSPDKIDEIEAEIISANPNFTPDEVTAKLKEQHNEIIEQAAEVFTGEFNEFVENVRKSLDQIIDTLNPDKVTKAGWDEDETESANALINDFAAWIAENRDEITALQIFYGQPYQRRELTFAMIRDLCEKLKQERPKIAPVNVWQAYQQLESTEGAAKTELTALVALIRKVCGIDEKLTDYGVGVDHNFQTWVMGKQAGALKFNKEQMQWLRMIKDHVADSFHIEPDDFELNPFDSVGGLGKMYQLFGDEMYPMIEEINEALAA